MDRPEAEADTLSASKGNAGSIAEQMLAAVHSQISKARKDKAQAGLKALVEKQIAHETALVQSKAEIKKYLSDFEAGLVP